MEGLVSSCFNNLYTKDPNVEPQVLTSLFECGISEEMNMSLCKPFAEKDVADVLQFQIGPLKAPSPDGFPVHFFHREWGTLREDVSKYMPFFVDGHMPKGVNDTAIELIPKVIKVLGEEGKEL